MKKVMVISGILLACLAGRALAQFTPQAALPYCNYTWSCAKTLGGTATACSCVNPSNNSTVAYIYTPAQVNAMASRIGTENTLVNAVVNAN